MDETVRVLHVEDEPGVAEITATFLERAEERLVVETTTDPKDALRSLGERLPDCIISDYDMAGMNGIEFLTAVRDEYPDLPFILYTGRGSEEIASEAITAGVTDYLQKGRGTEQYAVLANRITNAVAQARTERELEQQRQRFRSLFERLTQPTVEVKFRDDEPIIQQINPAFEDVFGYDAAEVVGNSLDTYIIPEGYEAEAERLNKRVQNGGSLDSVEVTRRTADGTREFLLQNALFDDGTGGFAIYTDITERKTHERKLEEQNARLSGLFTQFPEPTAAYAHEDGVPIVKQVNPAFENTFGYTADDAVGEDIDSLIVPPGRQEEARAIDERVQAGDSVDEVLERKARDEMGVFRFRNVPVAAAEDIDGYAIYADISEHKQRERELERTRDLLSRTEQLAGTGGWELDLETEELRWTDGTYAILDIDAQSAFEPTVGDAMDFYHAADRAKIVRAFDRCRDTGDPYDLELRIHTTTGRLRWIRTTGEAIREDGERRVMRGAIQDITDRKGRERTLKRLVRRTSDLFETTTRADTTQVAVDIASEVLDSPLAAVHLLSTDGERLELTAAKDEVRVEFGVPETYSRAGDEAADELVWNTVEGGESVYVEDAEQYGTLAQETPARSTVISPLGDHGVLIVSATEADAFDETDRNLIELLAGTLTAALDRVERESMLRNRTRQLEELHEAGQELIAADSMDAVASRIVSAADTILEFPITMVRYYDPAERGLVPVAWTEGVDDVFDSRETFTEAGGSLNWSAYESGSPVMYGDIAERDDAVDAESEIQSLMIVPLADYGTISVGSPVARSFDETDVFLTRLLASTAELALSGLETESELIRERDELDRQNDRLNRFASTLSHDLRNPLQVARGRIDLLAADCSSEHIEPIVRAHERMDELIESMLTLARAGSTDRLETVALSELARESWATIETSDARLELETEVTIEADPSRLKQLIENLVRNAIEHGGSEVTIRVGETHNGFYVEDDGPGIPPEDADSVLAPGYSTTDDGSGFGLSIVREIADAHGWDIHVTTGASGGARFEFGGGQQPRRG